MARPSPSCAHDDDRLRLPPASPPSSNSAEKKESTGPRLSQLCPPCAMPFSNSSRDYRRCDARIVENGFAASSGVSKSAKVVLGPVGLAVLERHLRGHARCPACARVYASLRAWQRHALINEPQRLPDASGLTCRPPNRLGPVPAVPPQ